jgi:hypothetical protein
MKWRVIPVTIRDKTEYEVFKDNYCFKHKNEHKNKHVDKPKTEHLKWDNDYGKRQVEQTLAMVGKVETNVRAD